MNPSSYPYPVNRLLSYGNCQQMQEYPNYLEEFGFNAEHIPDLIRMATDMELNLVDVESLEVWAPIHAMRTLGQLRAEEAIQPLVNLFYEFNDDWVGNELPIVFGSIGAAAISALATYLEDSRSTSLGCADVATSLTRIAQNYPDSREQCITILTQKLAGFAENDPDLNASLIVELVELKAVDSAPVIERAFAADRVAELLTGNWDVVRVSLGLHILP